MIKNYKNSIFLIVLFFISCSIAENLEDTIYLSLDDAIGLALRNNKSVMIALEKVKEQSAGKGIARASFFPQVNLSGTYTRLSASQGFPMSYSIEGKIPFPVYNMNGTLMGYTESIPTTIATIIDTLEMVKKDNYNIGASVTQTLFTWGKLINAYKIAGLTLDIEKESYRKAVEDLKLQVTEVFYQTMLVDKGVKLINESYKQMEKHIAQIEKLYQSGIVGQLDLLRAKVQLTNMRSQMIRIENTRTIAYSALKMVLGVDDNKPVVSQGEFTFKPYEIMLDEAIDVALQERSDIKNMRRTLDIAQKGLAIQRTANLPSVFTAFNYDYSKPFSFTDEGWGKDWNVTLGASMPLFTGGTNMYKLKQGKAQLKQAKLGLAMFEDGIKLDVKSSYFNLEQEKQILSYQEENVQTAEQALYLAEAKYNNGQITNLEYMDTQLALTQAKFDQMTSMSNCIIARAKLLNALGK
jgi:outer membrane protein TolC